MGIFEQMSSHDYEQLVFCTDRSVGLKAIICIHSTLLGPSLGGTRMWPYETEEEAIVDVLRLARAMTYKAAAAGLNLGGGKAVILADPRGDKSEALFRSYGRFVESLGGRYITAEDVGTSPAELEYVAMETSYATGKPSHMGGSGDSAPPTGLGVFSAMRACAQEVWGTDSLKGKTIAMQGFGKVASHLAVHLREQGVRLFVSEIDPKARERAQVEFGATILDPEDIHSCECDIFAPCALGGVLNSRTIPQLRCRIVCGAANNQLLEEVDGERLHRRGILYAPDYIVNSAGLINLSFELLSTGYDQEAAATKIVKIYDQVRRTIDISKAEGIPTSQAADRLAEERLATARKMKRPH